jgi:hypothetical protein
VPDYSAHVGALATQNRSAIQKLALYFDLHLPPGLSAQGKQGSHGWLTQR